VNKLSAFNFSALILAILANILSLNIGVVLAQTSNDPNVVNCFDNGSICTLDSGGANCDNPGYSLPSLCSSDPFQCCSAQSNISCYDVPCACTASSCSSGSSCTQLDPGTCVAAGGTLQTCSASSTMCGGCCLPNPPCTAPNQCISGYYGSCPIGYTPTIGTCTNPLNQTCCAPVAVNGCPNDYVCSYTGGIPPGSVCTQNAGIPSTCTLPNGNSGDCCEPVGGTYYCAGNNVNECWVDLATMTCQNGYGPCQRGDPTCTSCDELPTNQCTPLSQNRYPCVLQVPVNGWWCASAASGCLPCIPGGSTNTECHPPTYDTLAECDPTGSGFCSIIPPTTPTNTTTPTPGGPTNTPTPRPTNTPRPLPAVCLDAAGNVIGIDSAIGCIPTENQNEFVTFILRWGVGIGGGIALLLIAYASIMIITGGDNPEKVQAGKELLTAALAGLLLLVFSVFTLRIIGVEILRIPGF
jgi:hypothetical protein